MSHLHRRPLVQFETTERAALVPSMTPSTRRGKRRVRKTVRSRPRMLKGRINLRVAGYPGLQKIAPSSLIPYLPLNKLRVAARKALRASGKKRTRRTGKKRSRKTRRKT